MRLQFQPILGPVLKRRWACLGLLGIGGVQVALAMLHLPGWPCPLRMATGIPCPGCGMSRAVGELCRGHMRAAMELHALAPLVPATVSLLLVGAMLPATARARFATRIEQLEVKSRLVPLLLGLLLIYYVWRLMYRPDEVARIVAG